MPAVSVPWGSGELSLSLPDHWSVQQVAQTVLPPAPADWADRLAVALNQPGTGPPLPKLLDKCRRGRIVLLVEDITRHSPLPEILAVVMKEVQHAGIERDRLEIVFATGMHPPMTPAQAAEKLGPAAEGVRRRWNPWTDPTAYVGLGRLGNLNLRIDRGVAAADLRILISSVSPHLQAGFGGGYKMLLPGCADRETIRGLHRLGVGRTPQQLIGTDAGCNPMRSAIDAGGRLLEQAGRNSFALQYVLDEDNRPTFVAAGEVIPSQQMLAKRCAVACGVLTPRPGDVLITNAHPLDFDLWQSFKCIANTQWAVRRGGVIVCLSRCPAGLNEMHLPPWPLSPTWTRRAVRMLSANALYSLVTRAMPRLASDAAFFVRLAVQTLHRNAVLMAAPGLCERDEKFPGVESFAAADQAIAAADRLLGSQPQRAVVFPHGGTTYPVLPAGSGGAPARPAVTAPVANP